MISIIICSRNTIIDPILGNNIKNTIGVPYEIIIIDNSDNRLSIFEAYNEGAARSLYPYLCFMHDDIEYQTTDWGKIVAKHFSDEQTGAIGIAGSPYAAQMPGSWWAGGLVNINIIPWYSKNNKPDFLTCPETSLNKNRVITLDGVWFCLKKELFTKIRFDDINFKGFHFYDIDISLQIHQLGYKLYCVFDILIAHFSKGDMNKNWIENAFILKNKWEQVLPASCIKLTYTQQCKAELKTIRELVLTMLQNKDRHKNAYKKALMELGSFYKGYFYPPILFQLIKYFIGSIFY